MIRTKFNLVCEAGHKHYSPQPALFVGRGCSTTKFGETKKCEKPMRRLKTNG